MSAADRGLVHHADTRGLSAIVGMVALPMENPVRQFWDEQVWGAATKGTLALWPLATVVQFGVGR